MTITIAYGRNRDRRRHRREELRAGTGRAIADDDQYESGERDEREHAA